MGFTLLASGLVLRPHEPRLTGATGDPELVREVERFTTKGGRLSVVLFDPKEANPVRSAHWGGASDNTPYEIGSLTKGFTGLLVAQAVERGELQLDEPIGEILPLEGAPVANKSVRALVTHHSGLPTVPGTSPFVVGPIRSRLTFSSPYLQTEAEVLEAVRSQGLGESRYRYSNLGAALAGHAAATRAHLSYSELVQARITGPLGMHHTQVQGAQPLVAPGLDGGSGRPTAPWGMDYMAPAGALTSTPSDLTLLAKALAQGAVPGQRTAMAPLVQTGTEQIGYFWMISPWSRAGRDVVWHNGGTGGYATMFCMNPATGQTVIVLAGVGYTHHEDTATRLGQHLLRLGRS